MSASGNDHLSRRDFIKATTTTIGALIATTLGIPSLIYLFSPAFKPEEDGDTIALGSLEDYPIGIPTRFDFTRTKVNGWERTAVNYGLYVLREDVNKVRVLSDICTHLGCRVTWHPDQGHYISPCHDGHFDIVGRVVSGPPPRPLDEFITRIEDGNLYIQLPAFKRVS